MNSIFVSEKDIGSHLLQAGYLSTVAHRAEAVVSDARKQGYVRFFLNKPGECLLCGSRNIPDLLIDVYMPSKEKTVYIHAICKEIELRLNICGAMIVRLTNESVKRWEASQTINDEFL
jgi:hypothetical protein